MDNQTRKAWQRFKISNDMRARNELIRHYAYLAKITAGRVISHLPPSMERDDLTGAGAIGLIKAVDQFDMTRQVKFETYAIALIRGAILDMLRKDDWVPRSVRERVKQLERVYMELEVSLGRPATEEEVATAMQIDPEELQRLLVETGRTSLLSLDDLLVGSQGSDKLHLLDVIHDESPAPSREVELHDRRRLLAKAIDRLPDRERTVVSIYYYKGMTFKEIGKSLTLSESRVYQLHTKAVLRLRGYLQRDSDLFSLS